MSYTHFSSSSFSCPSLAMPLSSELLLSSLSIHQQNLLSELKPFKTEVVFVSF